MFHKLTISALAVFALSCAAFADEPRSTWTPQCQKTFEEARNLPAPTPSSIYQYGSRVVEQGSCCVKSFFDSNACNSTQGSGGGASRGD